MLCRLFFRALWSKRRQSSGHTGIKSRPVIVRVFCAGPYPGTVGAFIFHRLLHKTKREFFVNLVLQRSFGTTMRSASAPRRFHWLTLEQLRQSLHSARWSTAAACLHTALATRSMFAAQPVICGCCAEICTSAFRKNTARAWRRNASTG